MSSEITAPPSGGAFFLVVSFCVLYPLSLPFYVCHMDTIDLYEAIKQMRMMSANGRTFSFVHATYNRDRCTCDGIRHVGRASLRSAARGDDLDNADYKLFYLDQDSNSPRICWQMLILEFEGKKVILS